MDDLILQLDANLRAMLEEHTRLLSLIERKHQAMRSGRPAAITDCCVAENVHVQAIGELEKRRQGLMAELTRRLSPNSAEPLRLTEAAERIAEPARGRLLVLHAQLRQAVQQVRERNAVAQRATEALLGHVHGMMQMIGQAIGQAGTYSRRGVATGPAQTSSSFQATA